MADELEADALIVEWEAQRGASQSQHEAMEATARDVLASQELLTNFRSAGFVRLSGLVSDDLVSTARQEVRYESITLSLLSFPRKDGKSGLSVPSPGLMSVFPC